MAITKRLAAAHAKLESACQEAFEAANSSDHGSAPSYSALGVMADAIGKGQDADAFDDFDAEGNPTDADGEDATQEAVGAESDTNRAFNKDLRRAVGAHVKESGGRSAAASGRQPKLKLRLFSGVGR